MNIRKLSESDAAAVFSLAVKTRELRTGNNTPSFWSAETLTEWANSELGVLLVAEQHGKLAGFIVCGYNPISRDGYVHAVVVSPQARRSGVASMLLFEAERKLNHAGCNHVYALVAPSNSHSLRLFGKLGYNAGKSFLYVEKMLNAECKHSETLVAEFAI